MIKQEHLLEMIMQGNKAAGQISEFSYSQGCIWPLEELHEWALDTMLEKGVINCLAWTTTSGSSAARCLASCIYYTQVILKLMDGY